MYHSRSIMRSPVAPKASVFALLEAPYRRLSLAIWVTSFLSLFCIFGLSGWIPTLMQARGESFGASFAFGALMQVMSFVGGLVCGYLVDRTNQPRRWLCVWWVGGAISVLALVILHQHWINVVCSALAGFCIIGAQFVLNNFTAASYETGMRASAVGMELATGLPLTGRWRPEPIGHSGTVDAVREAYSDDRCALHSGHSKGQRRPD